MTTELKFKKPTILAVDDYEPNLIALQAVLGKEYVLVLATSGSEAISKVLSNPQIDIVLMDIQMPDMDGFETAARIKEIQGANDLPIIFITAIYKEDPFIKKGYAVGGIDYFSKPFDPEILKLKISVYASYRQKAEVLKERERQVQETEELLRTGRKLSAILEGLPVGVLITDVDGRVCQINAQVTEICHGHEAFDESSASFGQMLGWWDSAGQFIKGGSGPLQRALRAGQVSHSECIEIKCSETSSKKVLCSASPLQGLDGHIVGAVVVLQDLTESRKIEEDLEARITRLVSVGVELEESISQ